MSAKTFRDFYFGKRSLKGIDDLVQLVLTKAKVSAPPKTVKKLYLYKWREKQSLLIRVGDKIAKVYDSKDLEEPVVNWIADANSVLEKPVTVKNNKVIFPNRKEKSYLYDEDLFANQDLQTAINEDLK